MARMHTVEQGECLARIARKYGFTDYRTIYDHAKNAELRRLRPDPSILFPGDRVFIPDKEAKQESRGTTQVHRFRKPSTTRILRIAVEDAHGERLRGTPYQLELGGKLYAKTTTDEGILEEEIPIDAVEGTLRVGDLEWPILVGHLNPAERTPDDGVSGIQARLLNLGYDPGPIDGILGPRTEAAIRAFQRDHPPLVVDGICGPRTRAKLLERHGC